MYLGIWERWFFCRVTMIHIPKCATRLFISKAISVITRRSSSAPLPLPKRKMSVGSESRTVRLHFCTRRHTATTPTLSTPPTTAPYDTAIVTEVIPYLEKQFRIISQPYARMLVGGLPGDGRPWHCNSPIQTFLAAPGYCILTRLIFVAINSSISAEMRTRLLLARSCPGTWCTSRKFQIG